jgi:hypothetical protein
MDPAKLKSKQKTTSLADTKHADKKSSYYATAGSMPGTPGATTAKRSVSRSKHDQAKEVQSASAKLLKKKVTEQSQRKSSLQTIQHQDDDAQIYMTMAKNSPQVTGEKRQQQHSAVQLKLKSK